MNEQDKKSQELAEEAARWAEGAVRPGEWREAQDAVLQPNDVVQAEVPLSLEVLYLLRELALRQGVSYQTMLKGWIEERLRLEAQTLLAGAGQLRKVGGLKR